MFINGKTFVRGRCWFRHDTLAYDDPICGRGYYSQYRLTFMGDDSLRLALLQDTCTARRQRAGITKQAADPGKFKIGPLRNVALTAPYMHNGMFSTLREVIDYYNDSDKVIPNPINRDPLLTKPLGLTDGEKADLIAFLESLTDKRFLVSSAVKTTPKRDRR